MGNLFHRFIDDQSGVTAIEYGLICALIVIGIIAIVRSIGTTLAANFFGPIAAGSNGRSVVAAANHCPLGIRMDFEKSCLKPRRFYFSRP